MSITIKANENIILTTFEQKPSSFAWEDFFPREMEITKLRFCKMITTENFTRLIFHIPSKKEIPFLEYVILFDEKQLVILAKEDKDFKEYLTQLNESFIGKYGFTYVVDDTGAVTNSLTGEFAEDEEWGPNGEMPKYIEYLSDILIKIKRNESAVTCKSELSHIKVLV